MAMHGIVWIVGVVVVCVGAGTGVIFALIRRPWWLSNALGFAIGAFPLAKLPGLGVPIVLALTAAIAVAALTHRPHFDRVLPIEVAIVALIGLAAFSVPANLTGLIDVRLFLQWAAATSLTVILLRISRQRLHQCGQFFVAGAVVGAAVGVLQVLSALPGIIVHAYGFLGYPASVFTSDSFAAGVDQSIRRLTGPFGHPNAAALVLLIALLIAAVTYRSWVRAGLALVLTAVTALTLSRAIGLSLIVAILVLIMFQSRGRTARLAIAGTLVCGLVAALAVPAVRARIVDSFTSNDVGSTARWEALTDYPQVMDGHWSFGVGWGRREFWDPATSYLTNYVANAPLVTIYRGGLLVGIAFCAVLALALISSFRGVRHGQWEAAILGAGFIGFVCVGAQLDHPIATAPAGATVFALLLTFVADMGRQLDDSVVERATSGTKSPAPVAPAGDEETQDEACDAARRTS